MSYLLVFHELFIELPTLFKGIDRKTVAIKAKNRRLDTGTERGHSSPSKRTLFHANPNHILHARLYRYQKQIKNFFIAEIIFNLLLLWEDRRTNAFTKASFNRKLNEVSKWFLWNAQKFITFRNAKSNFEVSTDSAQFNFSVLDFSRLLHMLHTHFPSFCR